MTESIKEELTEREAAIVLATAIDCDGSIGKGYINFSNTSPSPSYC